MRAHTTRSCTVARIIRACAHARPHARAQDSGVWPPPGSSMYRDDCDDASGIKGLACLTLVGWIFSIGCTYRWGYNCFLAAPPLLFLLILLCFCILLFHEATALFVLTRPASSPASPSCFLCVCAVSVLRALHAAPVSRKYSTISSLCTCSFLGSHPDCFLRSCPALTPVHCSGFILMVVSVVWSANLHSKISKAWSLISMGSGL